jgi:hypothetical protein
LVGIELTPTLAMIDGVPIELLEQELSCPTTGVAAAGPHGVQGHQQRQRFFAVDGQGRAIVMAGLVERVEDLLQEHGYDFAVEMTGQWTSFCWPAYQQLRSELSPAERDFADALTLTRGGQLIMRHPSDIYRAIEIVCRYCLQAKVVIPVATLERVDEIYNALVGPLRGGITTERGRGARSNRLICTYQAFAHAEPEGWDVVLVTEPEQFFQGVPTRERLYLPGGHGAALGDQRRFAVLQGQSRLDAATQLLVEGYCGPVIYRAPATQGELRPVRVIASEAPPQPPASFRSVRDRKRWTCWRQAERNKRVARLAVAMANQERLELRMYGVGLYEQLDLTMTPGLASVSVVVESEEHGRYLQRYLRWPLLTGKGRRAWEDSLPDRSIITVGMAMIRNNLPTNSVVVASGGEALARMPGFPVRCRSSNESEVHVLEIADDFDPAAQAETKRRLDAYRARGWQVDITRRLQAKLEREIVLGNAAV